jgi:hypothetical protein
MKSSNVSASDLAYCAGIVDGEGCIGIYQNRKADSGRSITYSAVVVVAMTRPEAIEFLAATFGGALRQDRRKTKTGKPVYRWVLHIKEAVALLEIICPFLKVKKANAENVLEYSKYISSRVQNPPGIRNPALTQNEKEMRHAFYVKAKALNA